MSKALYDCKANYFNDVEEFNSGGGCMIDLISLDNGYVLAITDEALCIHPNKDSAYSGVAPIVTFSFPSNRAYESARARLIALWHDKGPAGEALHELFVITGDFIADDPDNAKDWVYHVSQAIAVFVEYNDFKYLKILVDELDKTYRPQALTVDAP